MIVGDRARFAIESEIDEAYETPSLYAWGRFRIWLDGRAYGCAAPRACALAQSFDEVRERIDRRGSHLAPFARDAAAGTLADSVRRALYADDCDAHRYFGMDDEAFRALVYGRHLLWAPDGGAAFDDSSYVLQLDVDDRVRLVGFRSTQGFVHDAGTLSDVGLSADEYYQTLARWRDAFLEAWKASPKTAKLPVTLFKAPPSN